MSSRWGTLPFEILTTIFDLLKLNHQDHASFTKDVQQCALVCRGWKLITEQILFSKIKLDTIEDIEFMQHLLSTAGRPTISDFVKELYYNPANISTGNRVFFGTLDNYFPNLQYLYTSHDTGSTIYRALESGRLPYLRNLPLPKSAYQDKMYVNCLELRKQQLRSISLFGYTSMNRDTLSLYYDKLHQFSRLECLQIKIINNQSHNIVDLVENMTLETGLSSLKQLEFVLATPINVKLTKEIDTIQPILNLKKLIITATLSRKYSTCHEDYMLYIMKKFPNLNYIDISPKREENTRVNQIHSGVKLSGHPPSTVVNNTRFLNYLSNFSYCNITAIITNTNTIDAVTQFHSNHSTIDTDWHNHHIVYYFDSAMSDIVTGGYRPDGLLGFEQNKEHRISYRKIHTFLRNGGIEDGDIIRYLRNAGKFMQELTVVDCPSNRLFGVLYDIYQTCRNLKRLYVLNGERNAFSFDQSPQFSLAERGSINEIVLSRCIVDFEMFVEMADRVIGLKSLTLDNCYTQNSGSHFFLHLFHNADSSLQQIIIHNNSASTRFVVRINNMLTRKIRFIHFYPVKQVVEKVAGKKTIPEFQLVVEDVDERYYNNRIRSKTIQTYCIECNHLQKFIINYPEVTAYIKV